MRRTDVLFLTQNLESGGSQRQLVTLAAAMADRGHAVTLATFYPRGALLPELSHSKVKVVSLDKAGRWDIPAFAWRLISLVRNEQPRVIHGYLDMPNLLTLALRPFARGSKAVWGLRAAYVDWSRFDPVTRAAFTVGCRLARFADIIIANSFAGREHHASLGYPAAKMVVVPNGIDTDRFAPMPSERCRVRREWGVADDETLIGLVARLDPLKGHATFLRAATLLAAAHDRLRFVCVGGGSAELMASLQQLGSDLGLGDRLVWAGGRDDTPAVYNALDVSVSASEGEGFSNVIGESMACGVPCIVTHAGDSAIVAGDDSLVVPVGSPDALADGIAAVLPRLGPGLGEWCRQRVLTKFGVATLVDRTVAALGLPVPEVVHG